MVKIGIDIDGILAEYQKELLDFINKNYNKSYEFNEIRRDDCYDILGKNNISRALKLKKFYKHTDSLYNIKTVQGCKEAVKEIYDSGNEIFIVTTRFKGFARSTKKWLENNFDKRYFKKIFFSKILAASSSRFKAKKYLDMGVDIVIEDSYYIAKKCADKGIKVFLLDCPWNKGPEIEGIIRVMNWEEILERIKFERFKNPE